MPAREQGIPAPAMRAGASVGARLTPLLLQSLEQELMPARDQELMPEKQELMPYLRVALLHGPSWVKVKPMPAREQGISAPAMRAGASVGVRLTPLLLQSTVSTSSELNGRFGDDLHPCPC